MIFQSLMGLGKSRCDVLSGTTQGQGCLGTNGIKLRKQLELPNTFIK
jgi:hypothetical protein